MDENQKAQALHWLNSFTALQNSFFNDGDYKTADYWKGQVMGICKMLTLIDSDIDIKHFLNSMP